MTGVQTCALPIYIGDTVDVQYVPGYPRRPIRLTIAGIATMPAIGIAEGLHTSMGVGALMPTDAGSVTESLGPQGYAPSCNGPNMVFLRVRNGVGAPHELAAARRLSRAANQVLARNVVLGPWIHVSSDITYSPTCNVSFSLVFVTFFTTR